MFKGRNVNIDESTREYFRKYGQAIKQRIQNKPIRSGYKIWYLNLEGGYLYNFKLYQGKGSVNPKYSEYGHGPAVVLDLKEALPENETFHFFTDNLFQVLI